MTTSRCAARNLAELLATDQVPSQLMADPVTQQLAFDIAPPLVIAAHLVQLWMTDQVPQLLVTDRVSQLLLFDISIR